ncbi:hypothetical protein V6N13_105537 [Hibiscus sabdariffa]|uniref:Uncharacterized protein n=1 Tax=Hibiscus sabdariffa TaxID=183260 RepID=A0ABR2EY13_9ROSI
MKSLMANPMEQIDLLGARFHQSHKAGELEKWRLSPITRFTHTQSVWFGGYNVKHSSRTLLGVGFGHQFGLEIINHNAPTRVMRSRTHALYKIKLYTLLS